MGGNGSLIASSPAYPRGNPFGPTTVRSALVGSLGSSILTPCLSQYSTIRRAHRTLCRSISSMVSSLITRLLHHRRAIVRPPRRCRAKRQPSDNLLRSNRLARGELQPQKPHAGSRIGGRRVQQHRGLP